MYIYKCSSKIGSFKDNKTKPYSKKCLFRDHSTSLYKILKFVHRSIESKYPTILLLECSNSLLHKKCRRLESTTVSAISCRSLHIDNMGTHTSNIKELKRFKVLISVIV